VEIVVVMAPVFIAGELEAPALLAEAASESRNVFL
jgi:hypothetical protein